MENLNEEIEQENKVTIVESFENLKRRIDIFFTEFGLDLSKIPDDFSPEKLFKWKNERYEETDRPGTTLEEKVIFRVELAYTYMLRSGDDNYARLVWEELDDAQTMAEGGNLKELLLKIQDLSNSCNSIYKTNDQE